MKVHGSSRHRDGIACFSYLSAVTTLHTTRYPAPGYGSEAYCADRSIAADGPIVSAAAVMLGHRATLVSNSVACDETGSYLKRQLNAWGVANVSPPPGQRARTPFSTVIAAADGSRTWFPHLPGVVDELAEVDVSALLSAEFVYVDCYDMLGSAAKRPVNMALANGNQVFVNLGGSPVPNWLQRIGSESRLRVLQTSVAEREAHMANSLADWCYSLGIAELVIVTRGSHGAIAVDRNGRMEAAAPPVKAIRTQGAGSVFSAMLASRLLAGATAISALRFASAAGSLWCATEGNPPTLAEVGLFAQEHEYALT
jgi:sugar/nucleoside kinase (ribokinase family)